MFKGNDFPDLGGLIKALGIMAILGVLAMAVIAVQAVAWLLNHLSFH